MKRSAPVYLLLIGLLPLPVAAAAKTSATPLQKQLEMLAKGGRAPAILGLIEEMAALDNGRVAVLVPVAGVPLPSARNFQAAVEAVEGYKPEATVQALAALLGKEKSEHRQRTLILEGFGKRTDRPSLDATLAALESKPVPLRVAAIRAARRRRERAVIAPLAATLAAHWKSQDRVWHEAREGLMALTGRDFEAAEDSVELLGAEIFSNSLINTPGFEGRGEWPKRSRCPAAPPPSPTGEDLKVLVDFLKTLAADSGGKFQSIQ